MNDIVRTPKQLGASIRRRRKQLGFSQTALGEKIQLRQATISDLEAGVSAARIATLLDALAALDLELVVRPRSKTAPSEIEDIF